MADAGLKPADFDGIATAGETPVTVAHAWGSRWLSVVWSRSRPASPSPIAFPERRLRFAFCGLLVLIAPLGARPLPPVFAECYGGVTIGDRGGIICEGTRLHAPLTRAEQRRRR
jgi:hypothetical protein